MRATVKADWIESGLTIHGGRSTTPHRIDRARTEWVDGDPNLIVVTRCGKQFAEPVVMQDEPHPFRICKPCSRAAFYVVYRAYNARGRLLYVGRTGNFSARMRTHRYAADWWKFAARIVQRHYGSQEAASAAEREAIRTERPLFNITHATGEPLTKKALRARAAA